jgi:hypothetical protein
VAGGGAGDCPDAEVGKSATEVNANATEALANARGIDTCHVLSKPSRMMEVEGRDAHHATDVQAWRAIAGM